MHMQYCVYNNVYNSSLIFTFKLVQHIMIFQNLRDRNFANFLSANEKCWGESYCYSILVISISLILHLLFTKIKAFFLKNIKNIKISLPIFAIFMNNYCNNFTILQISIINMFHPISTASSS